MFHQNLKKAQWTPIETGSTAAGIPDSEFCFPNGIQGWVEHKKMPLVIRDMQVAWIERRVRLGGRVFIAVRRKTELLLFHGRDVRALKIGGIKAAIPLGQWDSPWRWPEIEELLLCGF